MLNDQGNIIKENILITKELLDFALANNYKISLKNGNYRKSPIKTSRGQRNNKDLVTQINELYLNGLYYPRDYYNVFGLSSPDSIIQIFKQLGLKTLSRKESQALYGDKIQQQTANTNIERYGETAPTKNREIRQKTKETCVLKYGVDNAFRSPELMKIAKQTMVAKYGVEHSLQSPELRAKAKATWNRKYGDGNWLTSIPSIQHKIRKTNLRLYGNETFVKTERFRQARLANDKRLAETIEIYEKFERGELDTLSVVEHLNSYKPTQRLIHLKQLGIATSKVYSTEITLNAILEGLGVSGYERNAKKSHGVIQNKNYHDMDFYFPELRLGIEVNGLAFHSVNMSAKDNPKSKDYHFEKFLKFHKSGIKVISFTDYELEKFRDDVIIIIKYHLNLHQNLTEGEELEVTVSKEFLKFNKIDNIEQSLNYGLFDESLLSENFENHQHQRFIDEFEYWDCGVIQP